MADPRSFRSGYIRRIVDDELDELFDSLPAILLDGPKGVGKTPPRCRGPAPCAASTAALTTRSSPPTPDLITTDATSVLLIIRLSGCHRSGPFRSALPRSASEQSAWKRYGNDRSVVASINRLHRRLVTRTTGGHRQHRRATATISPTPPASCLLATTARNRSGGRHGRRCGSNVPRSRDRFFRRVLPL